MRSFAAKLAAASLALVFSLTPIGQIFLSLPSGYSIIPAAEAVRNDLQNIYIFSRREGGWRLREILPP